MQYRGLHNWVDRKLGKPMICWNCGSTDEQRYAWANKSGEYKQDISDWERLCYKCHEKKDGYGFKPKGLTHCRHGHMYTEDNIYTYPDGRIDCRVCRRARGIKFRKLEKIQGEIDL